MAQYTINSEYASLIALDTHARTVTAKGINLETGETKLKRFNGCPSPEVIAAWIHANFQAPHYAAYESGCTGFFLCRELRNLGIDCDVIAISSIARSTDDKENKNDRRDAKRLLHELLNLDQSLSRVWLPDAECEGVRDLLRCCRDASNAVKRLKQQVSALLLRHGHVFNEKTPKGKRKKLWGRAHEKWIDSIDLGTEESNDTLSYYLSALAEATEHLRHMLARVAQVAQKLRWKPYVDALCCLKGIDTYSAMVYASEFGDFNRFKNGRSVSKYVGTTPKNNASGDSKSKNGHITKAGNSHVRTTLVEGCSNMSRRKHTTVKLKAGQVVSAHVVAACNSGNKRLIDRHRHLVQDLNKPANVAKIAVASEMARWVWHVGCMVQEEQEAGIKKA